MAWQEIDKNAPLMQGDRIRLWFNEGRGSGVVSTYLRAADQALVEWYISRQDDYFLRSVQYKQIENKTFMIFDIEIRGNANVVQDEPQTQQAAIVSGLTVVTIAGSIVAVGLVMALVLWRSEKWIESATDSPAVKGFGIALPIAAVAAVLYLWNKR